MERIETDLLVLGAGSGGLSVAAGAVQMGARVVLLEPGEMGGDCLNYGCVPSKALIAAAKAAHAQADSGVFGIAPRQPQVDFAAVNDHVRAVIAGIAPHDSQERFEGLGVRVIRAAGRFVSEREVAAGEARITARRIIVATGSSPLVPPIEGLEEVPYLTNETLFDLRQLPEHLVVIGGGPIGCEMAQAHARLGARVTLLEGQKVLGQDDPELAEVVKDRLREEGIELAEGAQARRVSQEDGQITVETEDGRSFSGSHLLVAVGRKPNIDSLDCAAGGVEVTKAGIKVDAHLRSTSNRRVYAVGDVAGGLQFTHVAGYHAGQVIREVLFGLPAKTRTDHLPRVTYTDPELAQVGLTEAQARAAHGEALEVVRFDYAENDRARADRQTAGFIKVMVHRGRPVGASIVGHGAGEQINLWSLALSQRMKMSQLAGFVAPYPTYGEIGKRAAGAYFSPRLFDNALVKHAVRWVQRWVP